MSYIDDLERDGVTVLPRLLDPDRVERLREVADGIRARYLRRHPVNGRPGFLTSPWHLHNMDHPALYEGGPDWWLPELLDLEADAHVREVWRAATGDDPAFVYGGLFMDPPLPYAVDAYMQEHATEDGAGQWHRDAYRPKSDEEERELILGDGQSRDDRHLLEIALVPSDAFEYVPGSHRRWDTPFELSVRKHGQSLAERTRALPGGRRIELGPGDAMMADGRGIHRGWYTYGVPRRTISLVYFGHERLERYPDEQERPQCWLEPAHLERLRSETRAFFEHQLQFAAARV